MWIFSLVTRVIPLIVVTAHYCFYSAFCLIYKLKWSKFLWKMSWVNPPQAPRLFGSIYEYSECIIIIFKWLVDFIHEVDNSIVCRMTFLESKLFFPSRWNMLLTGFVYLITYTYNYFIIPTRKLKLFI